MDSNANTRGSIGHSDTNTSVEARGACMQCVVRCHDVHRVWSQDCFDACPLCTSACHSSTNIPFFFKYVTVCMESSYYKPAMEVPSEFVKSHIADSVCHVELEVPHRRLWIVKVKHRQTECILAQGWKDFAASYHLARGDALLFQLIASTGNAKCHFLVKIFKQSPLSTVKSTHDPSHPQQQKCQRIEKGGEHDSLYKARHAEDGEEDFVTRKAKQHDRSQVHNDRHAEKREEDPVVSKAKPSEQGGQQAHPVRRSKLKPIKKCVEYSSSCYEAKHAENEDIVPLSSKPKLNAKDQREDQVVSKPKPSCKNHEDKEPNPSDKGIEFTTLEKPRNVQNGEEMSVLSNLKPSEKGVELKTDVFTPSENDTKLKEQAKPYASEGALISVGSPIKRAKNAAIVHDHTRPDGLSCDNNWYVRRKTALEAMTKMTSYYTSESCKENTGGDTFVKRKAAVQAICKMSKYKDAGSCKSTLPKEEHGQKHNYNQKQEALVHYNLLHPPLSFLKTMVATNVGMPFLLHIPKSFAQHFMEQTEGQGCFDLTLTLEQTGAKREGSGQGLARGSWLARCRRNAAGATALTSGWREFACANKLNEGDVCAFKLVEPFTFMIEILPAAQKRPLHTKDCKPFHYGTPNPQQIV